MKKLVVAVLLCGCTTNHHEPEIIHIGMGAGDLLGVITYLEMKEKEVE